MVAVMEWCSVKASQGKNESEDMLMKGMSSNDKEGQVLHHHCNQAGPYGQRCSLRRNLVEGLWLI